MVNYETKPMTQLVIDETTYFQNKQAIDAVWEKCPFKNWFIGMTYVEGYNDKVVVWLIPHYIAQHHVQAISDEITSICMVKEAAE